MEEIEDLEEKKTVFFFPLLLLADLIPGFWLAGCSSWASPSPCSIFGNIHGFITSYLLGKRKTKRGMRWLVL